MRVVLDKAEDRHRTLLKQLDIVKSKHDQEKEAMLSKHIQDVKEITGLVDKVKKEN